MSTPSNDSPSEKSPSDDQGTMENDCHLSDLADMEDNQTSNIADDASSPMEQSGWWTKLLVAVLLVTVIVFVILDSTIGQGWVREGVNSFLEWIQLNPVPGLFVFILVYFAATILFIPGSILTLGAGFVFAMAFGLGLGLLLGTLAVFVGASAGAILAFLIGRFLLRGWVTRLTKKYTIFQALDKALAQKGFRIMVLLRLSPIIPFNVLNYVAGITAVGFWEYVWALFAILPGTILYVFLGASAGSLTDIGRSGDHLTITIIVIVTGVFFGILAVALISYYARQELRRATQEAQDENDAAVQGPENPMPTE